MENEVKNIDVKKLKAEKLKQLNSNQTVKK